MTACARTAEIGAVDAVTLPEAAFAGASKLRFVSRALGTEAVFVNVAEFEAGARARPHLHDTDQVLLYLEGEGVVATDGGEDQVVVGGEFVVLPADVVHMHGASTTGPAVHVSIMPAEHSTEFDCPIPEAWAEWAYDRSAS